MKQGFEPEIAGSKNSLKLIDYITIDGGFERGVNKDETFTKQSDILAENNFQLIDRNMNWMRALFVRRGT